MNELTKLIAEFQANLAKFEEIAKRMEERESAMLAEIHHIEAV